MFKLSIAPDEDNYQSTDGPRHVFSRHDGGLSRVRSDYVNSVYTVDVQWTLGPEEFQYMQTFYRVMDRGVNPFLIDLILTSVEMREYTARIIPGTWKLAGVKGMATIIKARLEVLPDIPDTELDEGSVVSFESFQDEASLAYSILEKLVNVDMPASMR